MTFKTILTITGPELADGDLRSAAALCEAIGAHLSVLVVQIAAPPPVGEFAAMVSDVWLEERREDERLLAARVEAITGFLSSSPVSADVSGEYCELVMADDVIGRRARYCDLTVIGPELLEGATLKEKAVEGVLFSAGGPLLLMPQGAAFNLRPRRVMVAWDARMEAARAVRDARGLLAGAEEVILTLVDPVEGEGAHGAEPGADAAAYLSRHGARVRVDRIPGKGRDVAEVLGGHAVDCGADMMVMGAYGHSRLRERIFGGVTRSFLDRPPLPVFMAR